MLADNKGYTLINRETREVAFRLYPVEPGNDFTALQRLNYYSAIWLFDAAQFRDLLDKFRQEMNNAEIAQYELLTSYLKIFLIGASRMKINQAPADLHQNWAKEEPFVLQKLKDLIEKHFRHKHAPADFARLLFITPKALGKLTKTHFNKTPSELIHERIIIEAKRELYLTNKAVKEIAFELGFNDEFYFSRFFKNNTEVSPQVYREKVGLNRGSNLSIN